MSEDKVSDDTTEVKEDKDGKVEGVSHSYKTQDMSTYSIRLPSNTLDTTNITIAASSVNNNLTSSERDINWVVTVSEGIKNNVPDDGLDPCINDEDSDWVNEVEHGGKVIKTSIPTYKHVENSEVQGERAKAIIMNKLGIGAYVQIPLWHSGFHMTVKPITDSQKIELHRQFTSIIAPIGRDTVGLIYSNTSVVAVKLLVELALDSGIIHTTTIKDWKNIDLSTVIKITDLYPLLNGLAAAMYPRGFKYRRACISDPDTCKNEVERIINPGSLLRVDKSKLTDEQVLHMTNKKPESVSKEDIIAYQNKLSCNSSTRYRLTDEDSDVDLYVNTKVPTLADEIKVGMEWIDGIEELTTQVLEEEDPNNRNSAIYTHASSSSMMEYRHWVDNIEIDTNIIPDEGDISENITLLSQDDTIRKNYYECISKMINKSTIALVGIRAFDCPVCSTDQQKEEDSIEGFSSIIPLNVLNVFFVLTEQGVRKIADR